jgi:predicted  nucleic acid-binding Zn-ribbon protein
MDEEVRELRIKAATVRHLETESQQRLAEISALQQTITELRSSLAGQQKHTDILTADIVHLRSVVVAKDQSVNELSFKHTEEIQTLKRENQALHEVSKGQSVVLSRDFEERIETLQRELTDEREARQRLIDDLDRVKQRHANLEDQMKYVVSCYRLEINLTRSSQSSRNSV